MIAFREPSLGTAHYGPFEARATPLPVQGEFFGHPAGFAFLFATEMWERFSYYGMRALLVLYMTKFLLLPGNVETRHRDGASRAALESMPGR